MARQKTVDDLSADELFKLAEQRRQQEQEAEQRAIKEKVDALRAEKRDVKAAFKKRLNEIDREIAKLTGKKPGGGGRGSGATTAILELLGTHGEMSTADLRAALEAQQINVGNLSQTLAYLKRTGRIDSPSHAVYSLA